MGSHKNITKRIYLRTDLGILIFRDQGQERNPAKENWYRVVSEVGGQMGDVKRVYVKEDVSLHFLAQISPLPSKLIISLLLLSSQISNLPSFTYPTSLSYKTYYIAYNRLYALRRMLWSSHRQIYLAIFTLPTHLLKQVNFLCRIIRWTTLLKHSHFFFPNQELSSCNYLLSLASFIIPLLFVSSLLP